MRTLLASALTAFLLSPIASAADSTETSTKPDTVEVKMDPTRGETKAKPDSTESKKKLDIVTTKSGLRYADLVSGKGSEAKMGSKAEVHYTLWFDQEGEKGKKIQSSKDGGKTFVCTVGQNLIAGWSEGMVGMKAGGTRQLWVPYELGYGESGHPAGIPPKQNLIFEIELVKMVKQ
ncbi:MAG: FKBP-type peptidyl-prolyl cis-trans isomerase [Candidatus Zixiibacteriota bacterium]